MRLNGDLWVGAGVDLPVNAPHRRSFANRRVNPRGYRLLAGFTG